MRKVKKANFQLTDHRLEKIYAPLGVEILSSPQAWEKFVWTHALFPQRPKEGYFVWVKKTIPLPLVTCVYLSKVKTNQHLENLIVLEKGVRGKMLAHCQALSPFLSGRHWGRSTIILKSESKLKIEHRHQFGEKDIVFPLIKARVGKGAVMDYFYENSQAKEKVNLESIIEVEKEGRVEVKVSLRAIGALVKMKENLILKGRKARGTVRLRLVAEKRAKIKAESYLEAKGAGQGHLDCQGLLLSEEGEISLIPALIDKNREALLTHEASIGKIKEEALAYLRARGFSEREAVNLLVTGFLKNNFKE